MSEGPPGFVRVQQAVIPFDPPALGDHETLTQYGSLSYGGFRCRPRPSDHDGLSLVRGDVGVHEAVRLVVKRLPATGDAVRTTTAGELRHAGFEVTSTPTKRNKNHVSVNCADRGDRDDDRVASFDQCFGEVEVYSEN